MSGSPGVLRDREGRLRSGWRVAAWLGAVFAALTTASLLGVASLPMTAAHAVRLALVVGVTLLAWRVFDGRPPDATWLAIGHTAAPAFGLGLLAGFALVGFALLPVVTTGAYELLPRVCRVEDQVGFLLRTGLLFLVAAALEELLFRGYPLSALESGPGKVVAVGVTSVLFALLHGGNPHYDADAALVLTAIGAVLAVSVLQRRSLWEAIGAHLGWNWALASVAALPTSGIAMPSPCYVGALTGPEWLTGGGFGLEAGAAAAGAWGLAAVALWLRGRGGRFDARR